jgi:fucose 4-O-acetylase-like acetyltransferase
MKNRDVLLYVIKGVCILLVVFAHTCKSEMSGVLYLFHMPFFFVLADELWLIRIGKSKVITIRR